MLRPLASPLPLAFFAFGVGSILLSGEQLGLVPPSEGESLAILYAAFVFPLQLLAAILCFLARETLGATVIGLISFSWLGTALVTLASPASSTSAALGLFNISLAVILLLLGTVGLLGKPLLSAIILMAVVRYGLNGVYELTAITGVQFASGVVGCGIFLAALYGGLALGLEDALHRTVLPFGRRGEAREAMESDLGSQVGPIQQEAGVRKQL